jgi:hypothetical protein
MLGLVWRERGSSWKVDAVRRVTLVVFCRRGAPTYATHKYLSGAHRSDPGVPPPSFKNLEKLETDAVRAEQKHPGSQFLVIKIIMLQEPACSFPELHSIDLLSGRSVSRRHVLGPTPVRVLLTLSKPRDAPPRTSFFPGHAGPAARRVAGEFTLRLNTPPFPLNVIRGKDLDSADRRVCDLLRIRVPHDEVWLRRLGPPCWRARMVATRR